MLLTGPMRRMVATPAEAAVIIDVDAAEELRSPVYDLGATEDEVVARWQQHYSDVDLARRRRT